MSRSRLGLAILALVAVLALALEGVPMARGAALPGECTWHRHSKRVLRHVRHDGRARAVKRTRHWWTCDPVEAAAPQAAQPPEAPATLPGTAPIVESAPPPTLSHLSVKAVEWSYTLSRPEVPAGEVVVELDNEGEDSHNLKLQREGSEEPPLAVPEAAASNRTSARLNLPPGTYHLYCSLYEHEMKGMHATLVVGGG